MMLRNNKNGKKSNNIAVNAAKSVINQGYDASVVKRALKRAGNNPNIKGHINEIRMVDKLNFNPTNLIKGNKAQLTKSPTAIRDDIIVKNGKNIIKRFQVKDTTSVSGAAKTAKQIASGKYRGTNVVGTKETVANVMKQKGMDASKQKITSNGLSSMENKMLAAKAGSSKIGLKDSVKLAGSGMLKTAGTSAAIAGIMETASSLRKIKKQELTPKKAAYGVGKETALAAAGGIGSKFAGDLAAMGVASAVGGPAGTVAAVIGGVGSSIVIDKAGRKLIDTIENKMQDTDEQKE